MQAPTNFVEPVPGHTLYNGNKILLRSGHYVDVFNITPGDVCINDVAHGCAYCPRWEKQTKYVVSSAQHAVMVYRQVRNEARMLGIISKTGVIANSTIELLLQALFHDGSDAYLPDIPSPVKKRLPEFIALEKKVMVAIASYFRFVWPMGEMVKSADKMMLEIEWVSYMHGNARPWTPARAEKEFLKAYNEILELAK